MKNEEMTNSIPVSNAGIVLISSLFPVLFEKLGLLNNTKSDFKDINSKICAIFVIQYLVNKRHNTVSNGDLKLNGILVDYPYATSLTTDFVLKDEEIEILEQMLLDVKMLWGRLKNTSIVAMQYTFFYRNGELVQGKEQWTLKIEKQTFDALIDIPMEYRFINFPWMKKPVEVIWQ